MPQPMTPAPNAEDGLKKLREWASNALALSTAATNAPLAAATTLVSPYIKKKLDETGVTAQAETTAKAIPGLKREFSENPLGTAGGLAVEMARAHM